MRIKEKEGVVYFVMAHALQQFPNGTYSGIALKHYWKFIFIIIRE